MLGISGDAEARQPRWNTSRSPFRQRVPASHANADVTSWPSHAPELTDRSLTEDVQEALTDRLQRYAQVSASAGMLVVIDQGVRWVMQTLRIQFPHTLTGMLIVVAILVSAKAAGETSGKAVDYIVEFFGPLRDWVARWMPVFFVPSLISLPLATASISGGEVAKIAQVILGGWSMSLLLAILTLRATRTAAHSEVTQEEVCSLMRSHSCMLLARPACHCT